MYGINDIVALAKAGFNREEIAKIINSQPTPAPVPQPTPATTPQPTPAPVPQPVYPPNTGDQMAQLLESMTKLTQTVQASNIAASNQPKPETTDDILAQIIGPNKPKEE